MISGTPKFNAVQVGELDASFLGPPGAVRLEAKVAFVDTKTGKTHGWTKGIQWSPETLAKLRDLAESMERDVARFHFLEDGSMPVRSADTAANVGGGLGEFLDPVDAPQV